MHRYIESRPPLAFFLIAAMGSEIFAGGVTPQPPVKYSPGTNYTILVHYRFNVVACRPSYYIAILQSRLLAAGQAAI